MLRGVSHLNGVQEVASSNLAGPTSKIGHLRVSLTQLESAGKHSGFLLDRLRIPAGMEEWFL